MNLGDAFEMAVPPKYDRPHLFFVISDPLKSSERFLIVNITTDQIRAGKECVLNIGDHPWIRQESFVTFGDTLEIPSAKSLTRLIGTLITMKEPLDVAILARIRAAGLSSKAIPTALKKYL